MFLLLFSLFIIFLFHQLYWKRRNLPPGPTPLPLIGNALSINFKNIKKWKDEYGDVNTIWIGPNPVITINDAPTIFETFIKDGSTYEDRPSMRIQDIFKNGHYGIGFTNGGIWREHRRFSLKVLRDFGLGKNLMQERILTEVTAMINDIKEDIKDNRSIISIQDDLERSIGSVINLLTLGYRLGRDKTDEFEIVKNAASSFIKKFINPISKILETNVDLFKHIPPFKQEYIRTKQEGETFEQFFMKKIDEHKQQIDFESNQEPLDYCEAFLRKKYELEKNDINDHTYSDKQLYAMIFDLWVAGQETTSTTLSWLCAYMINYPEIQEKIHQELKTVIGSDRIITVDDKNDLPYTNAVIAELQRYHFLATFNVLHRTTKDVIIHGYRIPKGTSITYQNSLLATDSRYFKNSEKFDPERFINDEGKFFWPSELIPFGVGKRVCLGEGLAKMELYLFTANIFNQFKLLPENSSTLPSLERDEFESLTPKKYKCKIELNY